MIRQSEDLNVAKSSLTEFFTALRLKLHLLTHYDTPEYQAKLASMGSTLSLERIRRPLLVIAQPGVGKTEGIMAIKNELNLSLPKEKQLGFKKILLGQTVVGSLTGIPVVLSDGRVVRVQIPDLPNPEVDGEYGILFLDEITTADEAQMQPALGLADGSRCIGEYTLPEHWLVVAAGNGPDCTNFVRLDDAMISRFMTFDIAYNTATDFLPYAVRTGLDERIISFLRFKPELGASPVSTDMDSSGKLFPCPRTWERLSDELMMQSLMGVPVGGDLLPKFASRLVGTLAGYEFAAFTSYYGKLTYDVLKILEGKEEMPPRDKPIDSQVLYILVSGIYKHLRDFAKKCKDAGVNFISPLSGTEAQNRLAHAFCLVTANAMRWILGTMALDFKIGFIAGLRNEIPDCASLIQSSAFMDNYCPEYNSYYHENKETIMAIYSSRDGLESMKI